MQRDFDIQRERERQTDIHAERERESSACLPSHPLTLTFVFWHILPLAYPPSAMQDAHDLLLFVLDSLHEDVNLVAAKPYTETSEVRTLADEER